MKDKTKNIIVTILFLILVIGGFIFNCLIKDKNVSLSERRKLKQFPEITMDKVLSGKYSSDLESYAMDQFVGRDTFRAIKAMTNFKVLRQKDNNGYFMKDEIIYKQTGKLNEKSIEKATSKFNKIQDKHLKNSKVYFSIIPDKNYYSENNELRMDYGKLEEIMVENLKNMEYISLFEELNKNDYYKTDTHWKQENLIKIAEKISKKMTGDYKLNDIQLKTKGEFYGVYAGQIGLKIREKDTLKYITTPIIDNSKTYNIETNKYNTVYDENKWNKSSDKYDYFLSGATPIIKVNNPEGEKQGKKDLIIFRDSFGSSLSPLLIENYANITLVDIRYISSDYLDKYIEFNDQDVLFLYSTLVLNESSILK